MSIYLYIVCDNCEKESKKVRLKKNSLPDTLPRGWGNMMTFHSKKVLHYGPKCMEKYRYEQDYGE